MERRSLSSPAAPLSPAVDSHLPSSAQRLFRSSLSPQYFLSTMAATQPFQETASSHYYSTTVAPTDGGGMIESLGGHRVPQKVSETARQSLREFLRSGGEDSSSARAPEWLLDVLAPHHLRLPVRERCELLEHLNSHITMEGMSWADETLLHRLLRLLHRVGSEDIEAHHSVRRRAFTVLKSLLQSYPLHGFLAPLCEHVLLFCRVGLDDAFPEVQQEAVLSLHLLLAHPAIPRDTALNGLAACLERWLASSPGSLLCTPGWLELLNSVGRLFEQRAWRENQQTAQRGAITRGVVHRIVQVLHALLDHAVPRVRYVAVLVLVVLQWTVREAASMVEEVLSPSQLKLMGFYAERLMNGSSILE